MSNGPLPSQLSLLSKLSTRGVGDKVRFLGCVTSYSTATAVLTLEHRFPRDSVAPALVDVKLLLETLKSEQTQIGEWVNVIGYIEAAPERRACESANQGMSDVRVQALVLWSAGPLNLDHYEACVAGLTARNGAPDYRGLQNTA